jgi:hypothetical protein
VRELRVITSLDGRGGRLGGLRVEEHRGGEGDRADDYDRDRESAPQAARRTAVEVRKRRTVGSM